MKVAAAVAELERKYEAMRERAEKAEGLVRMYEARDDGAKIAPKAMDSDWRITWKLKESGLDDEEPMSFQFSPALWLIGLAETFIRNPKPMELRIERVSLPSPETEQAA